MQGYNFENFSKAEINAWMVAAQKELPTTTRKSKREILYHIIRGGAKELLFRWRHNI